METWLLLFRGKNIWYNRKYYSITRRNEMLELILQAWLIVNAIHALAFWLMLLVVWVALYIAYKEIPEFASFIDRVMSF
jgi:hypothetical protein